MEKLSQSHKKKGNGDFKRASFELIQGFTLVELVVVISVMSVIFGLGYANFRDFQRRKILEGAVKQVVSDLRLTQSQVLAGDKPTPSDCDTRDLISYVFGVTQSYVPDTQLAQYTIYARCDSTDVVVKGPVDVPDGVDMTMTIGTEIEFLALGKGASVATLSFALDGGGVAPLTIQVTSTGEIIY